MFEERITIDVEKLRRDLKDDCYGAFFGGGFGGAMMDAFDIEKMSPQEIVRRAQQEGIDLRKYRL